MRGESGDVGVGMVGGPGGVVDPELTRAGAKTPVSPPLSAAASQVSLVPSDLTTSDPDLTMSSAASTVSSSGVTTPDLQPPSASEDDQSEPPMSPSEEEPPEPPIPLEEEDEEEEEEMEVEEHATSETPSTTSQDDPMAPHTPTESSNPSEEEHCPSTPDEEEQVLSENGVTTAGEAVKEAAKKEEEISKGALTPVQPDAWDCEESQKLPTPEAYRAETVEFPTSPMALKTNRRMSGVCFAGDEDLGRIAMSNTDTTADTTAMVSTPLETPSEDSDITPPNTHNSSTSSNFLTPNFRPDRPTSLNLARRKIAVTDDILRSPVDDDAISVSSAFSQNDEGEIDDEDLALPEEHEEEVKPVDPYTTMPPPQLIPELTAMEETAEERHWRSVVIGGIWRRIDMKVIAPYRKCLSHGGYIGDDQNAIIVFSSCFLPDRSRRDYNYVMDNLFLYVLSMLEQLVTEDYILVYLSGGTPRSHMPNFQWLKRAYQMIDRKLRKNLKALHVVHPTFWVRTVVALTRPFISTKFYKKLTFVNNLTELAQILPLDKLEIPDAVKHYLFFAERTLS